MNHFHSSLFLVNEETNKQWVQRFLKVRYLAGWVSENLKTEPVRWEGSRSHAKKRTDEGKMAKSFQYVYEHLAVGKMMHPMERVDPLFTRAQYVDDSMITQLRPGAYSDFQRVIQETITELHAGFRERRYNRDSSKIEWAMIQEDMNDTARELTDQLRDSLCGRFSASEFDSDWVDQEMIGLVLRYKCMGAFSDNLHGSVPSCWMDVLGSDYVECFASPFNHKFKRYYSIYEQDRVFGSLGNFFAMVEQNNGTLPLCSKYEINPPWNNQMYERVQEILSQTLCNKSPVEAIVVGPSWTKTSWIPGLTSLIESNPQYTENSFKGERIMHYYNDMQARKFPLKTVYWVFSVAGLPDSVLKRLDLEKIISFPRERRRALGR